MGCGYNLRTLHIAQNCPECGLPVERTLVPLKYADTAGDWLYDQVAGASYLALGWLALALAGLTTLFGQDLSIWALSIGGCLLLLGSAIMLAGPRCRRRTALFACAAAALVGGVLILMTPTGCPPPAVPALACVAALVGIAMLLPLRLVDQLAGQAGDDLTYAARATSLAMLPFGLIEIILLLQTVLDDGHATRWLSIMGLLFVVIASVQAYVCLQARTALLAVKRTQPPPPLPTVCTHPDLSTFLRPQAKTPRKPKPVLLGPPHDAAPPHAYGRTPIASDPALLDAEQRVCMDRNCLGCGYNLRTQSAAGRCPECGRPVADSIRSPRLADLDPLWLQSAADTIGVLGIALGLSAALWLAAAGMVLADLLRLGSLLGLPILMLFADMTACGAAILAFTRLPRRRNDLDRLWRKRRSIRFLLFAYVPVILASPLLAQSLAMERWLVTIGLAGVFGVACVTLFPFYLARLLMTTGERTLQRRLRLFGALFPLVFVAMIITGSRIGVIWSDSEFSVVMNIVLILCGLYLAAGAWLAWQVRARLCTALTVSRVYRSVAHADAAAADAPTRANPPPVCPGCGRPLPTAPAADCCPECGVPIDETGRPPIWERTPRGWYISVSVGALILGVTAGLVALAHLLAALQVGLFPMQTSAAWLQSIARTTDVCAALPAIIAIALLTRRNPAASPTAWYGDARRAARVLLLLVSLAALWWAYFWDIRAQSQLLFIGDTALFVAFWTFVLILAWLPLYAGQLLAAHSERRPRGIEIVAAATLGVLYALLLISQSRGLILGFDTLTGFAWRRAAIPFTLFGLLAGAHALIYLHVRRVLRWGNTDPLPTKAAP